MDSPPPAKVAQSPSARLRLHDNSAAAARHSIMHSSAKGWSPLNIHKRTGSGNTTPLRAQLTGESATGNNGSTRRTSSSYRHMATNSLVANSPFKNLSTREGMMSNGIETSPSVIHERHISSRQLGQSAPRAAGSANTPKAAIGLGITSPARSPGSAIGGKRRVSSDRKILVPSVGGRKASLERQASGSKENDTPEKGKKRRTPRQSMAFRALVENEYVTHSPFLSERAENETLGNDENDDQELLVTQPVSPSPRRVSSDNNKRLASPSANLHQGRTSDSPTTSPQKSIQSLAIAHPSPLREETSTAPTPTKSSLAHSKRLVGPRGQVQDSPTRKTVTFRNVPEVKEFDPPSAETSLNLSFDQVALGDEEDEDWTDDGEHEEDWLRQPDLSQDSQNSEDINPDESTTALFMDSLIEEGLFSPPELDTPAFADQASFELPMESSPPRKAEMSQTMPSSPHHVHTIRPHLAPGVQPDLPLNQDHNMLRNADAHQPVAHADGHASLGQLSHQDGPLYDPFLTIQTTTDAVGEAKERNENGVPLGRTSHSDRVHAARVLATQKLGLGYPGALPKAASPVERPASEDSPAPSPAEPSATTTGSDVFGEVISSPAARKVSTRQVSDAPELQGPSRRMAQFKSQKTVPVAAEQVTPKRVLPRPPTASQPLQVPATTNARTVSPSDVSEADSASSAEVLSAKREELQFTLPVIGSSPLLSSDAVFAETAVPEPESSPEVSQQVRRVSAVAPKLDLSPDLDASIIDMDVTAISKGSGEESSAPTTPTTNADEDEPLTPPTRRRETREDSPRIPSFEFGDLSIDVSKDAEGFASSHSTESGASTATPQPETIVTAPSPSAPSTPTQATRSTPTRGSPLAAPPRTPGTPGSRTNVTSPLSSPPVTAPRAMLHEFGPALSGTEPSDMSTNTRIRQRISRETIRENVSKRMTAEGLARPASVMMESRSPASAAMGHARSKSIPDDMGASPSSKSGSPAVKFGPPSPLRLQEPASPLDKALPARPEEPVSPRSPTVFERLRGSGRDSPKSALDRLMTTFGHDSSAPTSAVSASHSVSPGGADQPSSRGASPVALDPPSKYVQPVSILRRAEQEQAPLAQSVSGSIISNAPGAAAARRNRRRSASTGDADIERQPSVRAQKGKTPRISLGIDENGESILESMNDDFDMISNDRSYRVREQKRQVRATYTDSLRSQAGDLDAGRAWRAVHDTETEERNRQQRAAAAAKNAAVSDQDPQGLLFVKILGIQSISMPLPVEPTYFRLKLSNGVDYIYTPYFLLQEGANVNQEFCLSETKDNQFSILMVIRQDPHVMRLVRDLRNSEEPSRLAPPARAETPAGMTSHKGIRGFFASPRKNKARPVSYQPSTAPTPTSRPRESIANYFGGDKGDVLGKTNISIEPIAKDCELNAMEIRYPVFSMTRGSDGARKILAKVTVQLCRLPSLPGLDESELPGSIEELDRGLKWHEWHKIQHHEGKLTQTGGDCSVPRRRLMRLVGGYLHAVNEVTRKEVSTIDLSQAVEITDLNAVPEVPTGDYDPYAARPRSFQLKFADGETIAFTADKDEDKTVWMETMGRLIGKIPPNPEWVRAYMDTQKLGATGRSMSASSLSSGKSKVGPPRRVSRSVSKGNVAVSFERRGLERV